jgi:hypothetical protein
MLRVTLYCTVCDILISACVAGCVLAATYLQCVCIRRAHVDARNAARTVYGILALSARQQVFNMIIQQRFNIVN